MTDALPAELMPAPFDPDRIPADADDPADLEPLPPEVEAWEVTDTGAAEWAMRLLAAYAAEGAAISDQAALYREQIDLWERHELGRIVRKVEFFRGHLERFALDWRHDTGRATLTLPSGEVKTTKRPARIEIVDEAAVLAWARALATCEADQAAPRKVSLSGVQELCVISDRVHRADVYLTCGCIAGWTPGMATAAGGPVWPPEWQTIPPAPLSVLRCPECGEETAVGQCLPEVEQTVTYLGRPVPGLGVRPEDVTVKVKPR